MHRIESPADAAPVHAAGKALLLLAAPQCPDSTVVVERLARIASRNSSLLVAHADSARVPGLVMALGITQLPTVVLFRRGQRMSELAGRATSQQLQELVDSVLW